MAERYAHLFGDLMRDVALIPWIEEDEISGVMIDQGPMLACFDMNVVQMPGSGPEITLTLNPRAEAMTAEQFRSILADTLRKVADLVG